MGNVDRDEGKAHLVVPGGNRSRHVVVRLELDDEVDSLANEVLRVPEGNSRLIAIVEDEELHTLALGGPVQARAHLAREGRVVPLRGIADAAASPPCPAGGEAVSGGVDLFEKAAEVEGTEESKGQALAESRPLDDVAETQDFARGPECPESVPGMDDGLNQVTLLRRFGRTHGPSRLARRKGHPQECYGSARIEELVGYDLETSVTS